MNPIGGIPTTDGRRYSVVCKDCGLVRAYPTLVAAHREAQAHATTLRRGQYHHNVTVREAARGESA